MPHFISVRGSAVSEPQAHEIIVRTQRWPLVVDDLAFAEQAHRLFGITATGTSCAFQHQAVEQRLQHQCLDLPLLQNGCIVAPLAPWGAGGWISWTGQVGCCFWPLVAIPWASSQASRTGQPRQPRFRCQNFTAEWRRVAQAFPYLQLQCQLYWSSARRGWRPTLQGCWTVQDGQVSMMPPAKAKTWKPEESLQATRERRGLAHETLGPRCQVGTSLERLRTAVQTTRHSLGLGPLDEPL